MYKLCILAVSAFLVVSAARAAEQDDVKAILDKAIKAHGGEDKLGKDKNVTIKMKGKFYGMGDGIDYTMEAARTATQHKFELSFDIQGTPFKMVQVVNGNKGWRKINDDTMKLSDEEIDEVKHELYVADVTSLVPLKEKEYKLSSLGEAKINKKAVVGLKVSRKDHRDVNLFFDKETGLLVKSETTVKDFMAGGNEINQETFASDYKDIDGRKVPMKFEIKRDGKAFVDGEATEYKFHDKLDDSVFAKP